MINQLVGTPSVAWTFIHPYDLGEILNNMPVNELIPEMFVENRIDGVFTYQGKKLKQSVFIPPTTTRIS